MSSPGLKVKVKRHAHDHKIWGFYQVPPPPPPLPGPQSKNWLLPVSQPGQLCCSPCWCGGKSKRRVCREGKPESEHTRSLCALTWRPAAASPGLAPSKTPSLGWS